MKTVEMHPEKYFDEMMSLYFSDTKKNVLFKKFRPFSVFSCIFNEKAFFLVKRLSPNDFLNWKVNMLIYIVTTFLFFRCTGKQAVVPLVKKNHQKFENRRITKINKNYKLVISQTYFLDIVSVIIMFQSDYGLKFKEFG